MQIGQRVKCIGFENDKYNPSGINGTIISLNGEFNPIIVLWDNGIQNSYTEKNLRIVLEK